MSPWLSDLFLSSQSDERLVALARAGHDRAFAAIVQRYRSQLHSYARHIDSRGSAEDLVQQTFLNALAALRAGTEVGHLRGWLHQILRNAASNQPGQMRIEQELDAAVRAPDAVEDAVERRMLAVTALSEVARLPARQKEALVNTAIQGRSRSEVAIGMGLSEGAVRQLVHRARAALRAVVTALTPFSLARWLAARWASGTGRGSELALGASGASACASASTSVSVSVSVSVSAGGIALKLGALVASGVVAGAVVASELPTHPGPRPALAHRSAPAHAGGRARVRGGQTGADHARPYLLAAVGPPPVAALAAVGRRPARSQGPAATHTAGAPRRQGAGGSRGDGSSGGRSSSGGDSRGTGSSGGDPSSHGDGGSGPATSPSPSPSAPSPGGGSTSGSDGGGTSSSDGGSTSGSDGGSTSGSSGGGTSDGGGLSGWDGGSTSDGSGSD